MNILKKSVILLIIFIIGIGVGIFFDKRLTLLKNNTNSTNDAYAAGWSAAQKRLVDIGAIQTMGDNFEIKSISGIVQKIEGRNVQIKIVPLEPFASPDLDVRVLIISDDTLINKIVKKSEEQYLKEFNELTSEEKKLAGPDYPNGGIDMFYTEKADLNQIKIGDRITVDSSKNIKNEKNFSVDKILIGE